MKKITIRVLQYTFVLVALFLSPLGAQKAHSFTMPDTQVYGSANNSFVNEAVHLSATGIKLAYFEGVGGYGTQVAIGPGPRSTGNQTKSEPYGYPQLIFDLKENPEVIESLIFENGTNQVIVVRSKLNTVKIAIPEGGGKERVLTLAEETNVPVKAKEPKGNPFGNFLRNYGILLLIGAMGFMWYRSRQQQNSSSGGGGRPPGPMSSGPVSRPDTSSTQTASFDDVAGCDEAVSELKRVVKGLVRSNVYSRFRAKLPAGILLTGPPGTGKTLLAKAVAGEAKGTFSSMAGSDFVEMYVGVGAKRVRDLFAEGRQKVKQTGRPHVIFIDEIDAIGKKRSASGSQGNQETENTLNAILVELDGMKSNEGIIVMAATNRVDMLDDALTRPGRFDAQVSVDLPDRSGREKIFAIHSRGMPLTENVNVEILGQRTYGYSGAEIELACNRAAIIAAERYGAVVEEGKVVAHKTREQEYGIPDPGGYQGPDINMRQESHVVSHHPFGGMGFGTGLASRKPRAKPVRLEPVPPEFGITLEDFDEAVDFVRYGGARTSRQKAMLEAEKRNTAYHEAAHACASAVLPNSHPVVKITIMSRSKALGYVQYRPANDSYSYTKEQALASIVTAMAGRVGQEIFLKTVDTGASNDFEQATQTAQQMVSSWGMSRLGHIAVGQGNSGMPKGMAANPNSSVGPKLSDEIDSEWRRIAAECRKIAEKVIEVDRERVEAVTKILLEKETILADEWQDILKRYPSKVTADMIDFDPAA